MRILSRLRFASIFLLIGLALALALLGFSVSRYNTVKQYNLMLWNLHAIVSDRAFQRDQYFLFKQTATKKLWSQRQEKFISLVMKIRSESLRESDQEKLQDLIEKLNDSEIIFQRIFVLNGSRSSAASSWLEADHQFEIRLVSQMLLKDVAVSDLIDELQVASEKHVDSAYQQLMFSLSIGILILVALAIFTLRFTAILLRDRLQTLHQGATVIAGGRLDFRLDVEGGDELSELAQAINAMTADLQAVKASWEAELDLRKNIELELRRNDALLKSSARIAGVGAWELNFKTQEVQWSEQSCVIYQMPEGSQPTFDEIMRFFTPEARPVIENKIGHMIATGESFDLELEVNTLTRKLIFVRFLGQIEYGSEGEARMIATLQDVTEQRVMDRIKSEFISMVSHELRTPLTSVRGSLSLLESEVLGRLEEKPKKLVVVAHRNAVRLIGLVNDILDINKLASGAMIMDMQKHDLIPLILQVIENNAGYAREYLIELEFISTLRSAIVDVDAGRLMQILTNLISNAVKFSGEPPLVRILLDQFGEYYQISVVDTGPGISEQFKKKIFGQFAQENSSNTRINGGSGLGLHISKNLIEKMHGSIGFDSQIDIGTTFWIRLVMVKSQQATNTPQTNGAIEA
ncbi:ATP-binding protein [Undibacterium sp. SXout20W]|uniref:sensor histidine kinase n=1 Tax=Undibacterium sp. SXout20W TaxID=3413051 RepID=UPI003BF0C9FB